MNGILSFYECRFSGGDTMRWWGHTNPTVCKKYLYELFALTGSGDIKTSDVSTNTQEPPLWIFHNI